MVRQIWGARVLQSGTGLPDCEIGGGWAFSLFPDEELMQTQMRTLRHSPASPGAIVQPIQLVSGRIPRRALATPALLSTRSARRGRAS